MGKETIILGSPSEKCDCDPPVLSSCLAYSSVAVGRQEFSILAF